MQDAMAAQIGEDIVGWKIGGRPGGPFGRIFASTSFDSGATLPLPRYARNLMEREIGFKFRTEPFDVLLWAANELSRRGIGLKAGHIITPGSVTVPVPLPKGGTAVAVFEDLGRITVSLAAA